MLKNLSKFLVPRPKTTCGDCTNRQKAALPSGKREKYTLLNAAADTLRGDFATDAVRTQRLEVCKKCEYLALGSNCKLCGCFVHIKAGYAGASCDINRW